MISNHYPLLFATRYNWLIVAIVLAIGPVIRHFFNARHEGKGSPWWTWGVAAAGMVGDRLAVGRGAARDARAARCRLRRPFAAVSDIVILSRCSMCHARRAGVGRASHAPPKGVVLDGAEQHPRATPA